MKIKRNNALKIGLNSAAALMTTLASFNVFAVDVNLEDAIKSEAQGIGRFRGGWYLSGGFARGSTSVVDSTANSTRLAGFAVDGGIYGLFNPIRDFADFEAGLGLKAVFPTSSASDTGKTKYYYGYYTTTAYVGPVFRLGDSGSAIALGGAYDLSSSIKQDSQDPFAKRYSMKMKGAPGMYFEYQYKKPESKQIYFTRLTYNKYDLEFAPGTPETVTSKGKNQKSLMITGGVKF